MTQSPSLSFTKGKRYRVEVTDPRSPYRLRGKVIPRCFEGVYQRRDFLSGLLFYERGAWHSAHPEHITSADLLDDPEVAA